ncbi:MAG: alpha/beta fold hydrolase [Acidimicrobiales bacterium]
MSAEIAIHVNEWGDESDPVLLLAHGGMDFSRTFDVFAPLLAAGGWRVIAWDHRGHGDSETPSFYSWDADVRDMLAVLDSSTHGQAAMVGHSKGGALMLQLAQSLPHRCSHLANLDGLPSNSWNADLTAEEDLEFMATELTSWLDFQRRLMPTTQRKPGSIQELAVRRQKMNPRADIKWLEYLVTVGANSSEDGWRWKLDPGLRMAHFGPWRTEWSRDRMPALGMPFLGVLGLEKEDMGWGTAPEDILEWLPEQAQFEPLEDTGHFVHIEQADHVASLVLDFLR